MGPFPGVVRQHKLESVGGGGEATQSWVDREGKVDMVDLGGVGREMNMLKINYIKLLILASLAFFFFSLQRKLETETRTFVKKLNGWVCSSVVECLLSMQKVLGEYANSFVLVVTKYPI